MSSVSRAHPPPQIALPAQLPFLLHHGTADIRVSAYKLNPDGTLYLKRGWKAAKPLWAVKLPYKLKEELFPRGVSPPGVWKREEIEHKGGRVIHHPSHPPPGP